MVYGQPAVAVAIDQRMSVELSLSNDWRIDGMSFHPDRHPHIEALKQRLWDLGPALSIKISGNIPPASGLGSSAALSVAALVAPSTLSVAAFVAPSTLSVAAFVAYAAVDVQPLGVCRA